jgi:phosphotransferase system  glucose/maltose/N-acetylglucosamine-specific IIC component
MSLSQTYPAAAPAPESSVQRLFVIGVGVLIAALAVHVANLMDVRRAYTFLIGGLLGFVLYRAPLASPRRGGSSLPTAVARRCAQRW